MSSHLHGHRCVEVRARLRSQGYSWQVNALRTGPTVLAPTLIGTARTANVGTAINNGGGEGLQQRKR